MTDRNTPNKENDTGLFGKIKVLQKRIIVRMALVVLTLVLTAVLIFAFTIAWQTNVIQTEGLTFSAQAWDFNGEVWIDEQSFHIAPGDSGFVSMRLNNNSDLPAVIGVTVSKQQLLSQMHNRLYFYVEDSVVKNGETVDKIYLHTTGNYTYVAFPHGQVVLSEQDCNAPALKWEWVYDCLGYYVRGQRTETEGGLSVVSVSEYLCPIEYDYDEMKTTFDANGNLLTVDGETTAQAFLTKVSQTDGYAGTVDLTAATTDGYYPISVDENGYGVWAYLCDRDEIRQNGQQDAQLGEASAALGTVYVQVTGQNSREQGVTVSDETALQQSISGAGVHMVTLQQDVTLSQPLVVQDGANALINLNGYTLHTEQTTVLEAQTGSTVTVYNGTVSGGAATEAGIAANGAVVTLSKVNIDGVDEGITVFDKNNTVGMDSRIYLSDCSINARLDGLWVYGNGAASEQKTVIIIERSYIEGTGYSGIIFNGTYYGTDVRISDSTVKGKYTSVYFPQKESVLRIDNSYLEGHTGVVVKGGTAYLQDCVIKGMGAHSPLPENPSSLSLSGWVDTGDGVYLEANYNTGTTAIYISGEKTVVSSAQQDTVAVRQYPNGTLAPQASIVITGGKFSSDVSEYTADGYTVTENGGEYTVS